MSGMSQAVNPRSRARPTQRMRWDRLLCQTRLHPKTRNHSQERSAFEVDYDRLIFSKPFRRLARKTQVHPLATNDHTHNRLTHSLEVASVGRSMGKAAFQIAQQQETETIPATAEDFAQIVQAACLAHDVGNTPFGHAGERAIRHWMKTQTGLLDNLHGAQKTDLTLYEGNAQAFRLMTRTVSELTHGGIEEQGGVALTCATLATMLKYPWHSDNDKALANGKYSIFQSDREAFEQVVDATGMLPIDNAYCRHPLAFLVEAADDICNAVIDIEDAIDLQILQVSDVKDSLLALSQLGEGSAISQMRASAIGKMIEACLYVFAEKYKDIMVGCHANPLVDDMPSGMFSAFSDLNAIAQNKVYPFQKNAEMENGCIATLSHILNAFTGLDNPAKQLAVDTLTKPLIELVDQNSATHQTDYENIMRVMDFVAGMTDNYAVNLSGRLAGDAYLNV